MSDRIVLLTGGVGGAKLALGLQLLLPAGSLTAIVNVGDDFEHLGLHITPDIDTLLYTLSGTSDEVRGWGRAGESWAFMEALRSIGGEDWFQLGDRDLALHVERTRRLRAGETLSTIIADFATAWEVPTRILPMSHHAVGTWLDTDDGPMPFQRYFVALQCKPVVRAIRFEGSSEAVPAPGVVEAILDRGTRAVIIAPSNPYLSIDPMLSVAAIRQALVQTRAPVVAVSPLVGGAAVKGPTRKLMDERGIAPTPASIAAHYAGIIDALLIDERDRDTPAVAIHHAYCDTLMRDRADRIRVARAAIELADSLS